MRPITDPLEVRRYVSSPHVDLLEGLSTAMAEARVLLEGHFSLQSRRHSPFFIRFAGLGWNPAAVQALAISLVERASFASDGGDLTVLAPESAGLLLGRAVSEVLHADLVVAAIDHQRRPTTALRHGEIRRGSRVLFVSDVITTGESLRPLLSLPGIEIAGLLSFAVLSTDPLRRLQQQEGIKSEWLVSGTWSSYEPSECPLCQKDEPLMPAGEFN